MKSVLCFDLLKLNRNSNYKLKRMKSISTTAIQHIIKKSSAAIKSTGTGFIKLLVNHPSEDKMAGEHIVPEKKLQGKILSHRRRITHKQDILF